jgi:tRNA A-37 threonylcarbamoyl transferase component Bud32
MVEEHETSLPSPAATSAGGPSQAATPDETTSSDNASAPPAPETPVAWPHVSGYEILELLGQGGMGVVYKARHILLNRLVAIKMIRNSNYAGPDERLRFLAEAEAIATIRHPGVVQVHEFGTNDGHPYFALEFCPGGTLAQRLRGSPLPPVEAAGLIEQIARAIHAAHQHGIVHRDLKPGNVLLAEDGTPKVTDFGLAKRFEVGEGLTETQAVLGTPAYMAPEQIESSKHIGPAADVYALGAMLYECLTGRPPFVGSSALEILEQVKQLEPLTFGRLRILVPHPLEIICMKCLQKDPRNRYATAELLAEDLRRFLEHRPIVARPIDPFSALLLWCRRIERIRDAGVYAVALACVLTLWGSIGMVAATSTRLYPEGSGIRPAEARLQFLGLIALVYLPIALVGIGMMRRRLLSLWLGVLYGLLTAVFCQVMTYRLWLGISFDFGGMYRDEGLCFAIYSLLSLLAEIGLFLSVTALIAYYANRDQIRRTQQLSSMPPAAGATPSAPPRAPPARTSPAPPGPTARPGSRPPGSSPGRSC